MTESRKRLMSPAGASCKASGCSRKNLSDERLSLKSREGSRSSGDRSIGFVRGLSLDASRPNPQVQGLPLPAAGVVSSACL